MRARVLGGLAAAALVVGMAAPAWAEGPTVSIDVVFGGPEFRDAVEGTPQEVTVDVFSATSNDAAAPVLSVTAPGSNGFDGGIGLDLPAGSYRIRASAEGWRPSWYRAPLVSTPQLPMAGLYGWHADATFATASDVVVVDGAEEQRIATMLFRSSSSVAGFVSDTPVSSIPWEAWGAQDIFVQLVPVAGGTAVGPIASDSIYSFENVAPGTYTVLATIGGTDDGSPATAIGDLDYYDTTWYPGTGNEAARGTITVPPGGGHWVAANITYDQTTYEGGGGASITGDLYPGGVVAAGYSVIDVAGGFGDAAVIEGYQWSVGGVAVPGATARTFTVPTGSEGAVVSVEVRSNVLSLAVRMASTAEATIGPAPGTLFSAPTPTISGTPALGATLTAQPGTSTPVGQRTYQWTRDGQPIAGATAKQYTVTSADVGYLLAVVVGATKTGYAPASRTSDAVRVAELAFTSLSTPTIRGQARVGATLTAGAGVAKPAAATTSWQWYRGGVAIPGAAAATYVLAPEDVGAAITVGVSAQKPGYALRTAMSAPTAAVQPGTITAPKPTILGTAKVGSTLSIDTSAWGPAPLTITYQWQRSNGGSYADIPGATTPTYTPVAADRNKRIRLVVTVTKPGYTDVTRTTAPTSAVAP